MLRERRAQRAQPALRSGENKPSALRFRSANAQVRRSANPEAVQLVAREARGQLERVQALADASSVRVKSLLGPLVQSIQAVIDRCAGDVNPKQLRRLASDLDLHDGIIECVTRISANGVVDECIDSHMLGFNLV